ncbi:uncharacterized protein LY89DRAFT_737207 [Mollisia scopiformis]|uniref:Uncharacterized protein n=1 Tax=Mollisia scopiformis TaxID=149040 RepID=A0A194WZU6_MOLSC|nr:uncharacterized protein LY89DRAFT_737207 [Mollisia scopiformis]KUJ13229.1 hypothetical protein LY89DRAFT_737207 [Mollisia scopiformis]
MTETNHVTMVERPKHTPLPIALEGFVPGGLKPEAYSISDLASVLITHIRRTDLTSIQQRGLTRYKYQGSLNWGEPGNVSDMKKFFDIFNDVYFNGVLTGYCKLGTVQPKNSKSPEFLRYDYVYSCVLRKGKCRDARYKRDETFAYIMYEEEPPNSAKVFDSTWRKLNGLLAEMVLVCFSIFHCSCEHGCQAKSTIRNRWRGYDVHCQAVAYTIEISSKRKDLLGMGTELNGLRRIVLPVRAGDELPEAVELNQAELESGFDVEELRTGVKRILPIDMFSLGFEEERVCKRNVCLRSHWPVS